MRHGITRRLTQEYNPIPGKKRLIKALNSVNISVHKITLLCVKQIFSHPKMHDTSAMHDTILCDEKINYPLIAMVDCTDW